MVTNKYWIYLERLRRSGATNMYGAAPWLQAAFGLDEKRARNILVDWMKHYNPLDYDLEEELKDEN